MKPIAYQIKEIKKELLSHSVSYKLTNEIGWRRIAVFDGNNANARFYISQIGYAFSALSLDIISLNGWEPLLKQVNYHYSNSINRFNKARIVYKGNQGSYLEIYNNYENNNNGNITIYIDNSNNIKLLQQETIVTKIPDGYSAKEINLNYNS